MCFCIWFVIHWATLYGLGVVDCRVYACALFRVYCVVLYVLLNCCLIFCVC